MKKVVMIITVLIVAVGSVFINLKYNEDETKDNLSNDKLEFVNIRWTRTDDSDTEFLGFSEDGSYYYYCACGNPVNDSDVCETYTYDAKNKIINLKCLEQFNGTITKIKVVSYEEDELVLDFNGDIREFVRDIEE